MFEYPEEIRKLKPVPVKRDHIPTPWEVREEQEAYRRYVKAIEAWSKKVFADCPF